MTRLPDWYRSLEYRLQHAGGIRPGWHWRAVQWLGWKLYRLRRYAQGACRVADGPTRGFIYSNGIAIDFGGMCPVQGDGTVDGRDVYYRSRGEGWQFHVAKPHGDPLDDSAWVYAEHRYFFPAGGYVDNLVSAECIERAVAEWRKAGRP